MLRRIALGIDDYLDDFASLNGVETWKHCVASDPEEWEHFLVEVMNAGTAAILFNLDGVQVWPGISRASAGRGGPTDRELFLIHQNRHWWERIEWFLEGVSVPNPFE